MQFHIIRKNTSQRWRNVGGKRFFAKSLWEYRYSLFLQMLKDKKIIFDWHYEPKTFYFEGIKRGTTNYKPDFRLDYPDGTHEYVEVKGYYDKKSLTKIKRFSKYFPDEKLRVVDAKWFKRNNLKA